MNEVIPPLSYVIVSQSTGICPHFIMLNLHRLRQDGNYFSELGRFSRLVEECGGMTITQSYTVKVWEFLPACILGNNKGSLELSVSVLVSL